MKKEKFKFGQVLKIGKKEFLYCGVSGENIMGDFLVDLRNKKTGKIETFPVAKNSIYKK
jgi:hypothetical protein